MDFFNDCDKFLNYLNENTSKSKNLNVREIDVFYLKKENGITLYFFKI